MRVYLDNAASSPIPPQVINEVIRTLGIYGNPSSIHSDGREARDIIETAREKAARLINAKPDEVIFTPGGSACNTLATMGSHREVLYSPTAHQSLTLSARRCPTHMKLSCDENGFIDDDDLGKKLERLHCGLVAVEAANSEFGTIQNIKTLSAVAHRHGALIYADATGYLPYLPVDVKEWDVDMLGFSGHKLGALKGVGALYIKDGVKLRPLIAGSQERNLIGGTENVTGIASLGKACEILDYGFVTSANRDYMLNRLETEIPDCHLVGSPDRRLPLNICLQINGIRGEQLVALCDEDGVEISAGSACHSGDMLPSPALKAIGLDDDDAMSCIRIALSGKESKNEMDYACDVIKKRVQELRIVL